MFGEQKWAYGMGGRVEFGRVLVRAEGPERGARVTEQLDVGTGETGLGVVHPVAVGVVDDLARDRGIRSEERRVGRGGRCRGWEDESNKDGSQQPRSGERAYDELGTC